MRDREEDRETERQREIRKCRGAHPPPHHAPRQMMRWYDPELFRKDMEANDNYGETECEKLLKVPTHSSPLLAPPRLLRRFSRHPSARVLAACLSACGARELLVAAREGVEGRGGSGGAQGERGRRPGEAERGFKEAWRGMELRCPVTTRGLRTRGLRKRVEG